MYLCLMDEISIRKAVSSTRHNNSKMVERIVRGERKQDGKSFEALKKAELFNRF